MLEEKIDSKRHRITIRGKKEELHKMIYCLDDAMGGANKEILKQFFESKEDNFTFPTNYRVYIRNEEITIMPNAYQNQPMFDILKKYYKTAKQIYEKNK
jgi:hypothetical protein